MAKRRSKTKITSVRTGDGPTPERRKQNGGLTKEVIDRDCGGNVLIHRYQATIDVPLDAYFRRGKLTETEYMAAMKFRHAYLRAVLRVRVDDNSSGCHGDIEMSFLAAPISQQILDEAYAAISPMQKAVIVAVCGHDEWAQTTAKVKTLHRGLEKLADLWKLG